MSELNDDGEPIGDDGYDEATGRFCDALSSLVAYHLREYDLTGATVVGALALEALRRGLDVIYGDEEEHEGDGDEGEDDPEGEP